jgi:hypothetical protein
VTDIARHRADRLRVMNAIYEAAEGSRMSHVSGGWLLEHLELSDEELGGICRYLEGARLITAGREHWGHHTPFMILLTDAGIDEMKRSRAAPDQATEHFPPISVIHVEGDALGSAIQVGSPRAHQAVSVSHLNLDKVRQIVGEFEARAASLRLPHGETRQLRADTFWCLMPRRAAGHQLNPIFERDRSRQPHTSPGTTEEPIVAGGGGEVLNEAPRWSTTRAVTCSGPTPPGPGPVSAAAEHPRRGCLTAPG